MSSSITRDVLGHCRCDVGYCSCEHRYDATRFLGSYAMYDASEDMKFIAYSSTVYFVYLGLPMIALAAFVMIMKRILRKLN